MVGKKKKQDAVVNANSITDGYYQSRLNEFPLVVKRLEQDVMVGMHYHSCIELAYIERGNGLHRHDDLLYPIRTGDFLIVRPGETHRYVRIDNLRVANILFDLSIFGTLLPWFTKDPSFNRLFSANGQPEDKDKLHVPIGMQHEVQHLIESLDRDLRVKAPSYRGASIGRFFELVAILCRVRGAEPQKEVGAARNNQTDSVAKTAEFIEQKYAEPISIKQMATAACLSISRLSHIFKSATGMSISTYIIKTRIDNACDLLTRSNKSIWQIALATGFEDPGYFSRLFKKNTQLSPLQYRKKAEESRNIA
jgi:AraC-like DNA-binding protein